MRNTVSGFRTRLALAESSLARIMTITLRGGTLIHLTDAQQDIEVGSFIYRADPGFVFNAISFQDDGSPASVDLLIGIAATGPLSADRIIPGFMDGASAEVWVVDYLDPDAGAMQLGGVLRLGDIDYDNLRGAISIGLRSDSEQLAEYAVRLITPGCAWQLGDANCGVNITGAGWMKSGIVDSIPTPRSLRVTIVEPRALDGWYDHGAMKFTSGANFNLARDIRKWTNISGGSDKIELWVRFPGIIEVNDTFDIYPGCDLSTGAGGCTKFSNIVRYGGFPFVTEKGFNAPMETVIEKQRNK